MVFHTQHCLISDSNPLWLSSPAGSNQYLFSMLIMCSGIFGPLGGRSSLEKSAGSQDPLIQSTLPADRQLVCHLSMIPPWAMDFPGWATCRVCAWFSGRIVPVGTYTHRRAMLWQGSCTLFFAPDTAGLSRVQWKPSFSPFSAFVVVKGKFTLMQKTFKSTHSSSHNMQFMWNF